MRELPGTLRRHLPVVVSTGLALFAGATFLINIGAPHGPRALLWAAAPLAPLLPAAGSARLAKNRTLSRVSRRFWRQLALCCLLVSFGAGSDAFDALNHAPSHHMAPPTIAFYAAAVLVLLWSFCRLPLGVTGRRELLRISLDAGTVLIAGAVFMWHFQARPMLAETGYQASSMLMVTFTVLLEQLTIFAIAKVALTGRAVISSGALRLFAVGLFLGCFSSILQVLVADRPDLNCAQAIIPLVMVLATAGAEHQRRHPVVAPANADRAAQRPFSRLPYVAVVAVDALLLGCILTHDGDALAAAAGAVLLTAVVVWRQTAAFRENAHLLDRLDHSATHDALTQLPNRALFAERITAALHSRPLAVALIDLDDFKTVNDTLGHATGDALLIAVAERLTAAVRPGDTVARLGGDEFVVLLAGVTAAEATAAATRMTAVLADPVTVGGHDLLVRASIGIADAQNGDRPGDLLRRADIAMYAAKHTGGSCHQLFHPGLDHAVGDTAATGAQLQRAITDGQLYLEYQPIVQLAGGRLRGVEALVRWAHPARGPIPPADFIPIAERTGLIVALGDWVLRTACQELAGRGIGLNVNITARQLADPGFPDRVAAILRDTGVPADRLTLEITETMAVELGGALPALQALRASGVRVALDDFGTGRSTLTLLHELPLDQLKLDKSFTQGTTSSQRDTMPAAVLALARAVDLDIVAEGVETPEQAQRLSNLGYQYAQGYLFARPMPTTALAALLENPDAAEAPALQT